MAMNRAKIGQAPRIVRVNKAEALKIIKENKNKHVADYNKAVVEYTEVALLALQSKEKAVKKAFENLKNKVKESPVELSLANNLIYFDGLTPPESHEKDYEEIIEMLEMDVNDVVELDSIEFSQYIKDNWDWKTEEFNKMTMYASSKMRFQ